jgi:hypothetical protein
MPSAYGVATRRPPILLSIVTILMIIAGLLAIIGGIITLILRNDEQWVAEVGETVFIRTSLSVGAIISGLISVLLAIGLRRGSRVARALVLIYEVLHIIGVVYAMIRFDHSTFLASSIVSIVLALLIIWYLYGTRGAQEFFGDSA